MTISTERLADSAYIEACTKAKEASENSVCVIINGKPTWVSPDDIVVGSLTLSEIQKEHTDKFTKCSDALCQLAEKVNQLIDTINKHSDDITHLYNAVEQGEF